MHVAGPRACPVLAAANCPAHLQRSSHGGVQERALQPGEAMDTSLHQTTRLQASHNCQHSRQTSQQWDLGMPSDRCSMASCCLVVVVLLLLLPVATHQNMVAAAVSRQVGVVNQHAHISPALRVWASTQATTPALLQLRAAPAVTPAAAR
jgi:hypothetical protein